MDTLLDVMAHTDWLYQPKCLSSMSYALVAAITATFIGLDLIKNHMMPERWRRAMLFLSLYFGTAFIFGALRFYDSLIDLQYLHTHPNAVTTLSQMEIWRLEIPLFLSTAFMFAFLLYLNFAYYHKAKPRDTGIIPHV